jgi:multiple sugar transport system permease protein
MVTVDTATPESAAPAAPTSRTPGQEAGGLTPGRVLAWACLIAIIAITLFPFYWMLRTALSNGTTLATAGTSWLPVDFTWGAFRRVLGLATLEEAQAEGGSGAAVDFWIYLRNSVLVATRCSSCC